jgi:hypothetical protein
MQAGRGNAALNGIADRIRFAGVWIGELAAARHGAIGETSRRPIMPLAPALQEMIDGQEIELLHMDAQGAELGFLRYAKRARLNEKMHFLAVSTHHSTISDSATTHTNCLAELMRQGGTILRKRIVEESFSGDGLNAASLRKGDAGIQMPVISWTDPKNSIFGE